MQATVDAAQLKTLLKEAVTEVLEERRDLLQDVVEEALEDIAMIRAIDAGAQSENVSREEVFRALSGAA